jgi:hypothetical protein
VYDEVKRLSVTSGRFGHLPAHLTAFLTATLTRIHLPDLLPTVPQFFLATTKQSKISYIEKGLQMDRKNFAVLRELPVKSLMKREADRRLRVTIREHEQTAANRPA